MLKTSSESRRRVRRRDQRADNSRWKKWRRRGLVLATALALLAIFHAPILQGMARLLVVNDPLEPSTAVLMFGGVDGGAGYDELASVYHQGLAEEILVLQSPPNRLEQLDVVPPGKEIALRELVRRGVPPSAIHSLEVHGRDEWAHAERLGKWLAEDSGRSVTVVCNGFYSCGSKYVHTSTLERAASDRIRWRALPDRRYNPSNWWKNKFGVLAFCGAYLRLVHLRLYGAPDAGPVYHSADEYEQLVQERLGEKR